MHTLVAFSGLRLFTKSVFYCSRTGFGRQPVKWSPVARVKHRRTMGSKLKWETAPPLVRREAASPKSAHLWLHLFKQKLKHLPLLKTRPLPWFLPRSQHNPPHWSLTRRTMLSQAKTDSQSPPLPDEANPRGCHCQSSSAFVDPGTREDAYCKCYARKLKDLSNSKRTRHWEESDINHKEVKHLVQTLNLGFENPTVISLLL